VERGAGNPSPTYILPLPLGGGGLRRGWGILDPKRLEFGTLEFGILFTQPHFWNKSGAVVGFFSSR